MRSYNITAYLGVIPAETANVLPEKSKARYEQIYQQFSGWCERKNVTITEDVVLEYFEEKSKAHKASTLWTFYSMLKTTIILKTGTDISKFSRLTSFLKQTAKGSQKPQKSRTLTREQLHSFLREADDEKYLMIKVAVIFGITGGCRRHELTNMMIDHIEDKGTYLVIIIPDSNGKIQRVFTVTEGDLEDVNFLHIYRKYAALRPAHTNHNRFFLFYSKGKCSKQVVGIHTFGKLPKKVAEYLGLPNAAEYTGRCFKSSSASLTPKPVIPLPQVGTYHR